mmetsp:Transcript_21009/g.42231  ORF Transcript_21009/g.42231 Transcript_21009/m.42231 type:complete len:121 (+) Transcript_21009:85-447(+)
MSRSVASNYRFLLKHVKALPSSPNWKGYVIDKFKAGRNETDSKNIEHLHAVSNQYVKMIQSINELKYLRGLDTGEKLDPRDKIRATAGRVGLSVPRFADDAFEQGPAVQEMDEKRFTKTS